eukprot:364838-Chlamydomonas_euryale.AAC.5
MACGHFIAPIFLHNLLLIVLSGSRFAEGGRHAQKGWLREQTGKHCPASGKHSPAPGKHSPAPALQSMRSAT